MAPLYQNFKTLNSLLKGTIIISLSLFILSLTQPAFFIDRPQDPGAWSNSLALFLLGWTGFLGGNTAATIIWLANPLYILSIIFIAKKKLAGFIIGLYATMTSLAFSLQTNIVSSESGQISKIMSLGLGYKLWVLSMIVLSIGSGIYFRIVRKKRSEPEIELDSNTDTTEH